jgi:alpha-tubulin suppressor-like RCC1 family protein
MSSIVCTPSRLAPVLAIAVVVAALGCGEDAQSPTSPAATPGPPPTLDVVAAQALLFSTVSAGGEHTCGVTTDQRAYCWGYGVRGQLGNGTTAFSTLRPTLVSGGLHFAQVSAGLYYTCGITTDDRAYCWGDNQTGQLGDGTTTSRSKPVLVAGGRRFRHIRAGAIHTCAETPFDVAFCWGENFAGQLGDGTHTNRLTPVRVLGGLRFRRVNAGGDHTCGVTTGDRAYCWGMNALGQLGDGTTTGRLKPVAVAGGLSFLQVIPGATHTCGVTTENRASCWGEGDDGELGDNAQQSGLRLKPVAVAGTRRFRQVIAGFLHTCGVTTSDVAFCWGANFRGQNGNGTTTASLTPVRVAGGLSFSGVSTGPQEPPLFVYEPANHTCGVTTGHRAYCWGRNLFGQVGDGTGGPELTNSQRLTPVAVVGPM